MNDQIYRKRMAAVRRRMRDMDIDALVVTGGADVTYMTGFTGHDSWTVVGSRSAWLLTDCRYFQQARQQCRCCRLVQRRGSLAEAAAEVLGRIRHRRAAVEDAIPVAAERALSRRLGRPVGVVGDVVGAIRAVKDAGEVAAIRAAVRLAAMAMKNTLSTIKAGVTEFEVAAVLEMNILSAGARPAFETIVAFGANGARPHHQLTGKRLKKNDYILIDFGAKLNGYCCDITRCFVAGRPAGIGSYIKAYDAVVRARRAALDMVSAGADVRGVDASARAVMAASGLPVYGHGTGHGIGLEVHEKPVISDSSAGALAAGHVITVEPGVYMPGRFGIRIEDDVLVTENGCRVLTDRCLRGPYLSLK